MAREVMHVDMDAFFASVEQATYPFLRHRPVGVCGDPDGRTVIAAASYEAKAFGVKTAMTVPAARKLCPDIVLVGGHPGKYIDTSTRALAIYCRYTDLVEVFSIDEAFLDVTGSAHLFGGAREIARRIKQEVGERFRITCSIGVAPNKLLAKLAGEMAKPDGLTVVAPGDVPALLERTPVEKVCGIGPRTTARLNRLGVRTLAELGRLSPKTLRTVFGIVGIGLHNIGTGQDDSPVMPYCHEADTKSMGHSLTLEQDTRDIAVIKRHLLRLSEQVGRRLRQDGYAGRTVSLVLRYADFTTTVRQRSLGKHIDDGCRIYQTGLVLFDELYQPGRYIRLLGISVSNLVRHLKQTLLFEDPKSRSLFGAVDAVNDRFGEFSVARARLTGPQRGPNVIPPSWRPARQGGTPAGS